MSELDFDQFLGLHYEEITPDRCTARIEVTDHHKQPYGILHGGVLCSMVETLASVGAATWAMAEGMAGVVGVHNATDFLRSTRDGTIFGEATPIHRGRSQQLWQVAITLNDTDRLLARGQVRLHNLQQADAIGGIDRVGPSEG